MRPALGMTSTWFVSAARRVGLRIMGMALLFLPMGAAPVPQPGAQKTPPDRAKPKISIDTSLEGPASHQPSERRAARGYWLLTNKAYLPPDFDQQVFDELWKTWEPPLRAKAETASPDERRRMAFSRYGLTERPGDPKRRPLQYVVDERGNWSMNCLACHQGKVAGKVIPGVANSHFALETLTTEVRQTKIRMGKKLSHMDLGSLFMPLGTSNGTSNAVMFGVALLGYRDADLNIVTDRPRPAMTHHDHDAPPWWQFHRKRNMYIDGFAPKGRRALMQFILVKENGPLQFRQWERDFADIYAYLESLRAPAYPYEIDRKLATEGQAVFRKSCASCHGMYGPDGDYPERRVAIDVVQTDRVRLDALSPQHRSHYAESWFANYNHPPAVLDPGGYVAPPLDGIWASAPYFHNGSVPTLWHVLRSDQRPKVWRRSEDGYDADRVGLEVETFDSLPPTSSAAVRRQYFDTSIPGKSAAGHLFPDRLKEEQKRALLEYLKTL